MSEARPRLVALPEPPPGPRTPPARESRRLLWLLVVLTVLCAAGWLLAQRRSGQLERELAAARVELDDSRERIAALEAQRGEVRARLEVLTVDASALAGRLSELGALVADDQREAADAQLPSNAPATPE
jgi:septal ring factor EnvC (AmiA/AmiB activator)